MSDPIDARGLRCPWPALRLARALREAPAGAVVAIVADDPAAERELRAVAEEAGWALDALDGDRFELRRA